MTDVGRGNPAAHFFQTPMRAAGTRKLMPPGQERLRVGTKSHENLRMVGEEGLEPSKPYGG